MTSTKFHCLPRIVQNILLVAIFVSCFLVAGEIFNAEEATQKKTENYVAPPSYEIWGRGLVYNCKGKHWACVNNDAYLKCRRNMKWNTSYGKAHECFTVNVYAADADCVVIQLYNINTRAKTDFCRE